MWAIERLIGSCHLDPCADRQSPTDPCSPRPNREGCTHLYQVIFWGSPLHHEFCFCEFVRTDFVVLIGYDSSSQGIGLLPSLTNVRLPLPSAFRRHKSWPGPHRTWVHWAKASY